MIDFKCTTLEHVNILASIGNLLKLEISLIRVNFLSYGGLVAIAQS